MSLNLCECLLNFPIYEICGTRTNTFLTDLCRSQAESEQVPEIPKFHAWPQICFFRIGIRSKCSASLPCLSADRRSQKRRQKNYNFNIFSNFFSYFYFIPNLRMLRQALSSNFFKSWKHYLTKKTTLKKNYFPVNINIASLQKVRQISVP